MSEVSEDISEDGSGPGDSAVDMDVVLYVVARFREFSLLFWLTHAGIIRLPI
jgi:hypothetical protein